MRNNLFPLYARLFLLSAALLCVSLPAFAQSQATTGDIEGRVLDPNSAAVPNATVAAKNQETGLEKSVTSDEEGLYRLVLLPPGRYTVTASGASGFQPTILQNVTVTVGGKTPLDINLSVSGANIDVTVTAEAPVVETTRTSISTTVNQRAIENLPVNGRNYLDFATLTPGVIRDQNREGDLSVGGQKGTLNSLQVDGVDNNNTFFGQSFGRTGVRPPYQFSEESVQEFQVNQNGFSAEFGRAGGAVINVVTKSGTNEFHGGAFEYFRDESLNANTPQLKATQFQRGLPNKRPTLQIHQFGGRVGGPIVKHDRAFFFFTYDGQRQDLPNPLDPPGLFQQSAAIQALLVPRLSTYQISRNQDVYLAKTDIILDRQQHADPALQPAELHWPEQRVHRHARREEHSGDCLARTTTFSGTLLRRSRRASSTSFASSSRATSEPGTANSDLPERRSTQAAGNLLLRAQQLQPARDDHQARAVHR